MSYPHISFNVFSYGEKMSNKNKLQKRFTEPANWQWGSLRNARGTNLRYGFLREHEKPLANLIYVEGLSEFSEKTFELYGKTIDADIVYYKSIPFNEYFIRNMFKYKSKKWYKQFSKIILRNIPGFINFIVSLDNWNKRKNPIYDTTIIYQKLF